MRNPALTIAGIIFAMQFIQVAESQARLRVSDGGGVDACNVQSTFGAMPTDGAVSIDIGTYDFTCSPAASNAFSLNVGGTFYSSLFVNENGIVSLGAPITAGAGTPLGNLTTPAFAPFFADGQVSASGLQYGWTNSSVGFPNSVWITYSDFTPQGNATAAPNIFQVGFVDTGNGNGDFDVIFNYETINWDMSGIGAQAGIVTSLGNATLLSGALIPGAYLGFDDTSSGSSACNSSTPATALACNSINDGTQVIGGVDFNTGLPSNGYYLFHFRNGVLTNAPVNEVPIPAAFGLFALGLGGFAAKRFARKKSA